MSFITFVLKHAIILLDTIFYLFLILNIFLCFKLPYILIKHTHSHQYTQLLSQIIVLAYNLMLKLHILAFVFVLGLFTH